MIRAARPDDLPGVRDLERAAGQPFRDVGMSLVADDEPPSLAELAVFQDDGRAWVVTDDPDRVLGYVVVQIVDGSGHIEQVSVHPDHTRRGLGTALVETVAAWADDRGLAALTLTTYAEVPWNAPYYRRLGFRVVSDADLTPGLRRIREHEAARGLDRWPRVTMRRDVRRSP